MAVFTITEVRCDELGCPNRVTLRGGYSALVARDEAAGRGFRFVKGRPTLDYCRDHAALRIPAED